MVINLIVFSIYLLVFLIFRKWCGTSAKENAKQLKKRSQSFFQRKDEELEEMILKDILDHQSMAGTSQGASKKSGGEGIKKSAVFLAVKNAKRPVSAPDPGRGSSINNPEGSLSDNLTEEAMDA